MNNKSSYKFDKLQWLESKGFMSQTTIFLDLRFWIGMVEQRDANHIKLKKLLSTLVSNKRVICPVSPTLLLELKKQPSSEKRTQCCQLMDKLSNGLSIRVWSAIFKDEFKANVEEHKIEKGLGYSHCFDAFSVGMKLIIDKSITTEQAKKARDIIFSNIVNRSISDIINIEIDKSKYGNITILRHRLSALAKKEEIWKKNHIVDWKNIEQAEFKATLRAMLPVILSATNGIPISNLEFQTTTSEKDKTSLLNNCPTFWCHYQLMTALRSNRKYLEENDFWDIEHTASAVPYVEFFASDAGTRHICSDVLKLDKKYKTVIFSKIDDLIVWLESL